MIFLATNVETEAGGYRRNTKKCGLKVFRGVPLHNCTWALPLLCELW